MKQKLKKIGKIPISGNLLGNVTNVITCVGVFISIAFSVYSYENMRTQSQEYLQKQKPILQLERFQDGVNLYNFGGLYVPMENNNEVELVVEDKGNLISSLYVSNMFKSEINPVGYLVENFIVKNKINYDMIAVSLKGLNKNFQVSAYFLANTMGYNFDRKVYPLDLEPKILDPVEMYSSQVEKYWQPVGEFQFYPIDKIPKKQYIQLKDNNEEFNTQQIITKLEYNIKNTWYPPKEVK